MKKFAAVVFNLKYMVFMVYIAAFNINSGNKIYLSKKVEIIHQTANKVTIKVTRKYIDFIYIFSIKFAIKLLKYTEIKYYTIELINN